MIETREGGCHCGRVRFRARIDLALMSHCNCSLCTKKASLHLGVDRSDFELLSGEDALVTYQFNTMTAKHFFCRHCGVHSFHAPRRNPDRLAVNARALDGIDLAELTPTRFFDGRNWEEAQSRHLAEEAERQRLADSGTIPPG